MNKTLDIAQFFEIPTSEQWMKAAVAKIPEEKIQEILFTQTPENIIIDPIYFRDKNTPEGAQNHADWWMVGKPFAELKDLNFIQALWCKEGDDLKSDLPIIHQNFPNDSPTGTYFIDYDWLVETLKSGNHPMDFEAYEELLKKHSSAEKCITIDGAFLQNSGANMITQLAAILGLANAYVERFGVDIIPKMMVKMAVGSHFFFEIAKVKALTQLWFKWSDAHGKAQKPFIFIESSHRNKSSLDLYNNLIRTTYEGMAAVLGGADAVYLHPVTGLSNDVAHEEWAQKQQLIFKEESHLDYYADLVEGSYFVKHVEEEMCQKAWEKFQEMEAQGGFEKMMEAGSFQQWVEEDAQFEQEKFDQEKQILIGVNKFKGEQMEKGYQGLEIQATDNPSFKILKPQRLATKLEK